jgi:hypothetical protein
VVEGIRGEDEQPKPPHTIKHLIKEPSIMSYIKSLISKIKAAVAKVLAIYNAVRHPIKYLKGKL